MKRLFFLFLICVSCVSGEHEPMAAIVKPINLDESIQTTDVSKLEDSTKENNVRRYPPGRYTRPLDKGSVILLIHGKTDSTCEFVFDTGINTPYFAKIAGELLINGNGKATYKTHLCKTLDFQFNVDGISVKEYECATFHSEKIAFDGFYTPNK